MGILEVIDTVLLNKPTASVLVTGASGFIGRSLLRNLVDGRTVVRILTRGQSPIAAADMDLVDVRIGDLLQPSTLSRIADGIDTVYHLAGAMRDQNDDTRLDRTNRQGTEHLVHICRSAGVRRFLYLSSVGVLGAAGKPGQVNEFTQARPSNEYEASKFAGELAALDAHESAGMQVTVVRPSTVYGEGRVRGRDSFLSLIKGVRAGLPVLLGSDYVSCFAYLQDVVAACFTLANHPDSGGQVYIVNEPVPLGEFIRQMAAELHRDEPRTLPAAIGTPLSVGLRISGRFGSLYNRTVYSMTKLSNLGFKLPYGYREGLRRTIGWYRENGLL